MQKRRFLVLALFMVFLFFVSCSDSNKERGQGTVVRGQKELKGVSSQIADGREKELKQIAKNTTYEKLPDGIKWLTNDKDPVYASSDAKKGGVFHTFLLAFPLTFRVVGPDSNSSFRSNILGNQLNLIGLHPNTMNIIPEIATHWAWAKDKKTMYFKINKRAKWSDGVPVTAGDFAYTLECMRSKHIIAPWYNDYYSKEIDRVIVYDDRTLAVVGTKAEPDLFLKLNLLPTPQHFYGKLNKDFVKRYNWKIAPNTGAYQISDFKKGKYVKFKRKTNWWAKDLKYFKNRFNVDTVIYKVIRKYDMAWEYFKKAKLDTFSLTMPKYWHIKSKSSIFSAGYVNKIWFFNNTQRSAMGLWLNQDKAIFADQNVRYAFSHAMHIQKVIQQILRNDYFRLEHGFVGYGPYSDETIKARRYDLDKVNFYMKKSGWKKGRDGIWKKGKKRFSVNVTYSNDEYTRRLVVLKEEAKKAGIELKLRKLDPAASYKKVMEKKHEVAQLGWSTSFRPQYWEHFHSVNAHKPQTNNITNTDDPKMDKFIEAYRNSLDEKKRIDLSKKIQKNAHEIGSFVPTYMVPYVRQAYWRWWQLPKIPGTKQTGDLFAPFNAMTGGLFWFDEKIYKQTKKAMKKGKKFPQTIIVEEIFKKG